MLMPFLSVSAIGIVVGASPGLARDSEHPLLQGFLGAWAGFAAAALIGLFLDVTSGNGHWVPILGHIGAIVGSVAGRRLELSRG